MSQLTRWLIYGVALAAALGIFYVIVIAMGVTIPHFVITVFWIVLAAVLGIAAIKLVMTMAGPGPPA